MIFIELFPLIVLLFSFVSGQCPSEYTHFAPSNKCYSLVKNSASWDNARAQCRAQGGDLAVATSSAEHELLQQLN